MSLEGDVVFDEGLKVMTVLLHVLDDIKTVAEVITPVTLQLVTEGSEQAVSELSQTQMIIRLGSRFVFLFVKGTDHSSCTQVWLIKDDPSSYHTALSFVITFSERSY